MPLESIKKSHCHVFPLMQEEIKKAVQGDDCHGNPEIDRLRTEVQDTKEINRKLRELLQVDEMHTRFQQLYSFICFSVMNYLAALMTVLQR